MIEIIILFLIKWFLIIIIYLGIIVINMVCMFMYLFNYIMFVIVMIMSCNVIGYITRIEVLFSKILIISNIIWTIILSYIVCIIRVNGAMLINNNIISKVIIGLLYIWNFIYLIIISNIITIVINVFIYMICVIECSIILFLI